ncbi:MAG: oligosaccharide flippase family protein [Elusimicrobiaceae bacterium]|nr:oligosaccharide flippase family protein [Elusimicrobiaceae bacterium]
MLKDIAALGRESVIYGFSTVLARLLNFLLVPFYTYFLAPADYGVAASVFAYIAFLNIIYQYGMDQAYMRFTAGRNPDDPVVFSTPLLAVTASSAVLSAGLILFSGPLAELCGIGRGFAPLVVYSALVLALDAVCIVPFARLRMKHRAWKFVGVRTLSIAVNVGMNIVMLAVLRRGPEGIFIAALAASGVSLLLLLPDMLRIARPRFDRALFSDMAAFAWPFVPSGLASMIVQVVDRPIVMFLAGATAVGVYQAGYKMGIFMMLIVVMFDQAWRPFFLERARQPGAERMFARVFTLFSFAGVWVTLAIALFIGDLLRFPVHGVYLLHPDYRGGIAVVPLVLVAYLFYGFYINFMVAPVLSKKTGMLVWVTLAGGLSNIAGNFLLVPHFSIIGAGWATLVSYLIMAVCLYFAGRRVYPVPYEWSRVLKVFACAGLLLGCAWAAVRCGAPVRAAKLSVLLFYPVILGLAGFYRTAEIEELKKIFVRLGERYGKA